MKKIIMMAFSATLVISLNACVSNGNQDGIAQLKTENTVVVPGKNLALRQASLFSESAAKPVKENFEAPEPGEAQVYERSFENAPPLIPHSLQGLVPITKRHNSCLDCHAPDVAASAGATPIPRTHFIDFRSKKYLGHLAPQRFYCSECHVQQANVKPLVKNTFKPVFKNPSEKYKSDLLDNL